MMQSLLECKLPDGSIRSIM